MKTHLIYIIALTILSSCSVPVQKQVSSGPTLKIEKPKDKSIIKSKTQRSRVAKTKPWKHPTDLNTITFSDVYYSCEDARPLIEYPEYKVCLKKKFELRKVN